MIHNPYSNLDQGFRQFRDCREDFFPRFHNPFFKASGLEVKVLGGSRVVSAVQLWFRV